MSQDFGSPKGVKGADGQTPFINAASNWQIGDVDTGISAQGVKGADGQTILNSRTNIGVKLWVGSTAEYNAVTVKDNNTIYMVGE